MNKLELLSPAGDLEIFKSVINAGADAVFFGGDLFGARAFAKNFTIEEAAEAIKYAHFHNAKAYLTVNTLLKNLEIEKDLYSYLKAYVENGIDAFIVQDIGVFQFIKDYFPNVEIHASTQMSTNTLLGASLLENMGASRIVTSRELSIDEIAKIHERCPELEIESFVHGALCVCYSGQCLMSSIIGGRSGNRGRCAQPCRLPYKVYDQNGKYIKTPGDYVLSPRDFCTIEKLPEMIDAGVMSFKIEGRMKQINYATGVVSVYRKYIDQYLYKGAREYSVEPKDMQRLLDFGNRSGFTDLYLTKHNGKELITFEEPSHNKSNTTEALPKEKKAKLSCKVVARLSKPFEVTFTDEYDRSVTSYGAVVEESKSKPASYDDIKKAVAALGTTDFELASINIDYDDGIFLPVSVIKNTRRDAINKLYSMYLGDKEIIVNSFEEGRKIKNIQKTNSEEIFVSVATMEQLEVANECDFVKTISVPADLYSDAKNLVSDKKLFVTLPTVIRAEYIDSLRLINDCDGIVVCSMDGLGLIEELGVDKEKVVLDHRLYTYSNRAIDAFVKRGFKNNCLPVELSIKELMHRDNSSSQMLIYSRLPLMVTANCTIKNTIGCNKQNMEYSLKDRKDAILPVKCNCTYCYNTIYNSKKFIAFGLKDEIERLGVKTYRIDFTLESAKEAKIILESYKDVFINNMSYSNGEDYTKGHLKRGVE